MEPMLLVRQPPTSLASGIVSHIEDQRDSIDYQRALKQWQAYTQVYKDRGWSVQEVDRDDELPDSVFVEDGVVFVGSLVKDSPLGTYILTSPGNVTREGEVKGIEMTLKTKATTSSHPIARIQKPGTLDGGDVLKVPCHKTIYIGKSQRTNDEGIRQFTSLVSPLGWQVRLVPVKKALHLSK
jgi:dimethylargininase